MSEEQNTSGSIAFEGKAQVRKFGLIQLVHALALEINTPFRVGKGRRPSTVARELVGCSQTRKPDVLRELVAYCHEAFGYEAKDSVAKALKLAEPWEWEIHGDYGSGWELETTAASEFEARMSYDDYANNVPDVPHRIAKRRPDGYVKPAKAKPAEADPATEILADPVAAKFDRDEHDALRGVKWVDGCPLPGEMCDPDIDHNHDARD